jgi:transcriptional regulator with XRE-family HTH domain
MNNKDYTQHDLPIERGIANNEVTFKETDDFGSILRILRENHGMSLVSLHKKIGIGTETISKIERSLTSLPNEGVIRTWLEKLGCKDNIPELLRLYRQHKVMHSIRLHSKDPSNADLIRLIEVYKDQTLTDLDRDLLALIGRDI